MIRMILAEGKGGLDNAVASFGGRTFTATSRTGATLKLARALVEAGAPDSPVEARGTDGRLRFTAPSLHRLARWTISDRDRGGLYLERYRNPAEFVRGQAQDGVSGSTLPAGTADAEAA